MVNWGFKKVICHHWGLKIFGEWETSFWHWSLSDTFLADTISKKSNGLIQKSGVDEFLQEELDVAELRVLDAERLEEADVAVLHRHEDRPQVADVGGREVKRGPEVLDRLRLCEPDENSLKMLPWFVSYVRAYINNRSVGY